MCNCERDDDNAFDFEWDFAASNSAAKKVADVIFQKALETAPARTANDLMVMASLEPDASKREVLLVAATQLLETDFFRGRLQS